MASETTTIFPDQEVILTARFAAGTAAATAPHGKFSSSKPGRCSARFRSAAGGRQTLLRRQDSLFMRAPSGARRCQYTPKRGIASHRPMIYRPRWPPN
jgi:hypothetical protein